MGTRVPGYPHLKLMGTQVSLPGPGYIITNTNPLVESIYKIIEKFSQPIYYLLSTQMHIFDHENEVLFNQFLCI